MRCVGPLEIMSKLALPLLALLICCGGPRPAKFVVLNSSGVDLRDLTISGNGWTHTEKELRAGATAHFDVAPAGESGISLTLTTAAGKKVTIPQQGYFESGYSVRIEITPALDAKIEETV